MRFLIQKPSSGPVMLPIPPFPFFVLFVSFVVKIPFS